MFISFINFTCIFIQTFIFLSIFILSIILFVVFIQWTGYMYYWISSLISQTTIYTLIKLRFIIKLCSISQISQVIRIFSSQNYAIWFLTTFIWYSERRWFVFNLVKLTTLNNNIYISLIVGYQNRKSISII